eukprot:comp24202_c0_seq1/m.44449 comp24202_c0_seq1/g.44449  ORF comp24202_c0_seq1/g.44449 comp24202_c0_seq1/m.44449 type:complete len:462 (-) comp24202_c0_seq1:491-1876(-)
MVNIGLGARRATSTPTLGHSKAVSDGSRNMTPTHTQLPVHTPSHNTSHANIEFPPEMHAQHTNTGPPNLLEIKRRPSGFSRLLRRLSGSGYNVHREGMGQSTATYDSPPSPTMSKTASELQASSNNTSQATLSSVVTTITHDSQTNGNPLTIRRRRSSTAGRASRCGSVLDLGVHQEEYPDGSGAQSETASIAPSMSSRRIKSLSGASVKPKHQVIELAQELGHTRRRLDEEMYARIEADFRATELERSLADARSRIATTEARLRDVQLELACTRGERDSLTTRLAAERLRAQTAERRADEDRRDCEKVNGWYLALLMEVERQSQLLDDVRRTLVDQLPAHHDLLAYELGRLAINGDVTALGLPDDRPRIYFPQYVEVSPEDVEAPPLLSVARTHTAPPRHQLTDAWETALTMPDSSDSLHRPSHGQGQGRASGSTHSVYREETVAESQCSSGNLVGSGQP